MLYKSQDKKVKTLKEKTNNYTTYADDVLGPAYRDFRDVPSLYEVMLKHFKEEVEKSKDVTETD